MKSRSLGKICMGFVSCLLMLLLFGCQSAKPVSINSDAQALDDVTVTDTSEYIDEVITSSYPALNDNQENDDIQDNSGQNIHHQEVTSTPTDIPVPTPTQEPDVIETSPTFFALPTATEIPTVTEIPIPTEIVDNDDEDSGSSEIDSFLREYSSEQRNALSMLNYLTVLSQEINDSRNSRLFLESVYSSLVSNTEPKAVDGDTLRQIEKMLDNLEKYRMVDVKRDRLKYIFDMNQAQAFRKALPDPMSLLNVVQSGNPLKMVASVIYMATDATNSYNTYTYNLGLQYLQDGWELDDEEAATLHENRKALFSYMIKMVNEKQLPSDLALTEESVSDYISYKNNSNVDSKILFLEQHQEEYKALDSYWLLLADSYYEKGKYEKCLEAVDQYEKQTAKIFKKDYEKANFLPKAIIAAREVCDNDEYIERAARYAQAITSNKKDKDWALGYYAAEAFLDLYTKDEKEEYLEKAFDEISNNINRLVGEQRAMNLDYLKDVEKKVNRQG